MAGSVLERKKHAAVEDGTSLEDGTGGSSPADDAEQRKGKPAGIVIPGLGRVEPRRLALRSLLVLWGLIVLVSVLKITGVVSTDALFAPSAASDVPSSDELNAEVEAVAAEPEEDLSQKLLPVRSKLSKKAEKDFACMELKCIDKCNKKIKPKCAKSRSCTSDRDKICKKRCRKTRCEDRCKDEVKLGYVEREQKMDDCKDKCTGATAVHNKCIKKHVRLCY